MEGKEVIAFIKANYQPIADHHIIIGLSAVDSKRYYACAFKKVEVRSRKYGVEYADTSVENIMTRDLDEYKKFITKYAKRRQLVPALIS
jgi:hypothetical protein